MKRYKLIRLGTAEFSIARLCELMQVSRTAYYRYLRGASYQLARAKQEQLKEEEEVF